MDTTSVISITVVSAAVIIPIVYTRIRSKRKKQKFETEFRNMALTNGLFISEFEQWNHYAIGIDKESARLIYLHHVSDMASLLIIDLADVRSVEIKDISRAVETQNGRVTVLDSLSLRFLSNDKDVPPVSLEFYNSETDVTPHHEMEILTKWKKTVEFSL